MEDALASSEAFIRALKAPNDPPHYCGPRKIAIAKAAWETPSLYVPRKAGVILEWLITSFLKTKGSESDALTDLAHWELLVNVLRAPGDTQIEPMVSHMSIPSIISAFMTAAISLHDNLRRPLFGAVLSALDVLWPMVFSRSSIDAVAECLWRVLHAFRPEYICSDNGLIGIARHILTGFQTSFDTSNVTARKKIYVAFSQSHYQQWLEALYHITSAHLLYADLLRVGLSILYQPDILRATLETGAHSKAFNNNPIITIYTNIEDPLHRHALVKLSSELFQEYVLALRKSRSSIFPPSLSSDQINEKISHSSGVFIDAVLSFLKVSPPALEYKIWKAKLDIFMIAEKLIPDAGTGTFVEKTKEVARDAVLLLNEAWNDTRKEVSSTAYNILLCLFRIEPEIVMPFIPQILQRLIVTSPSVKDPALAFLKRLTEYHSKLRTLHDFVSSVISASSSSSFPALPAMSAEQIYRICSTSPLFSLDFFDTLSTTFHTFVTPVQAKETVHRVQEALDGSLQSCLRTPCEHEKTPFPEVQEAMEVDDSNTLPIVVSVSLIARIAGVALRGASSRGAKPDEVLTHMTKIDVLISDAVERSLRASLRIPSERSEISEKRSGVFDNSDMWTQNCLASTLIRFWYDVSDRNMAGSTPIFTTLKETTKTLVTLRDTLVQLLKQTIFPELQLEVVRVVFDLSFLFLASSDGNWPEFDIILNYLEENAFRTVRKEDSPGNAPFTTALNIWSLCLERYLVSIDTFATQGQLERLVRFIVLSLTDSSSRDGLALNNIVKRTFTCATFWELPNIRISMMSFLDKKTQELNFVDATAFVRSLIQGTKPALESKLSKIDVEETVSLYRLLHYFPPEYLPRSSRLSFAKRAMAADVLLSIAKKGSDCVERQVVLRSFLTNVAKESPIKLIEDMASDQSWIEFLTSSQYVPGFPTSAYVSTTLALVDVLQRYTVSAAVKGNKDAFEQLLQYYIQIDPFGENIQNERIAQESLLHYINMIVKNAPRFEAPEGSRLKELCLKLEHSLYGIMQQIVLGKLSIFQLPSSLNILEAWNALLLLSHYLSYDLSDKLFGLDLLKIIVSHRPPITELKGQVNNLRASVLSILAAEGSLQGVSACQPIETLITAYIVFTESAKETIYDIRMSRIIKTLSTAQYSVALDLVAESLCDEVGLRLTTLVHLSELLIRDGPDGTSKASHIFSSRCLEKFADVQSEQQPSETLCEVLKFIQYLCTDRAGSLKTMDVTNALLILFKALTGYTVHDEHTSRAIFQNITLILNALVRLRRDLLTPMLPQFGAVLRQLIFAMRGVRAMLGTKQYRLVADTFPKWINPSDPLSETEAQSLARLLTIMTTKSFIRSVRQQKADSLARPFARHAPYVLLAYLQAMNEPFCRMSVGVRRELEPGLYALCSMMGEHGRDTLMVQSLDAGEKGFFKGLWKEYERQKYVGKAMSCDSPRLLLNQGSTARDFLAFERNFLTQCRFGLLLSLLSSSFLLLARIPTPDSTDDDHPTYSTRVPFGCLFFVSGFASICLAVVYYIVSYRQMSHKLPFLRVSMFQNVTVAAMALLILATCVLLLAGQL